MRKKINTCVSLVLYCLTGLLATAPAWCATPSISNTILVLAIPATITHIPDVKPGDQVRYSINFDVQYLSIIFAWGRVTYNNGSTEQLILQFAAFAPGEHSLYWDRTVPSFASGETIIDMRYFSIPGGFNRLNSTFTVTGSTTSATYAGSATCMSCHAGYDQDVIDAYVESGHHFALSAVSGVKPSYPAFAPGVPDPPEGAGWSDISYVVGGYGWSANFASSDTGALFTGPGAQYNLANSVLGTPAEFVSYTPDAPAPGQFTCGQCHATGYSLSGSQDNRSSIVGTWFENAVGCEACHGPGAKHASSPYFNKPPSDPTISCANCHVSGSLTAVEAEAGLIRSRQQAEELNTSAKSYMECTTCHNPHASAHYEDAAAGTAIVRKCTDCHGRVSVGLGMQNLECIDCHMPYAVKSGSSITYTDIIGAAHILGDVRSHIFKINAGASAAGEMFSADGTQLALDAAGKSAGLTLDFVCLGCHRSGGRAASSYTFEQVRNLARYVHAQ